MYPQIPAGYALVRHHFTCAEGDGHAYLLYGVHNTGSISADSVAVAAISAYEGGSSFLPSQSDQYTHADVYVVANLGGTLSEATHSSGTVGGNPNPPMPPQVSVLVQKQTTTVGRTGRGRLYIPGFPSTALQSSNSGLLTNTALGDYQACAAAFFSALVADGVPMVLLHRNVLVAPTLITAFNVEQNVATQRRRNRKAAHG